MDSTGKAIFDTSEPFNSVKVFSATMMQEREKLGDVVTEWMQANADFRIKEIIVTQSSDEAFHCLAMTVFYVDPSLS